jgi:DNA-binding Lrp family transcriptional regulator
MLMIVRLYPKIDINKIWDYVEHEMKEEPSKSITPLYATQTEGMMDVGIIFDVKDPDDIAPFLTEEIVKCSEVHHTKTISLMKPVFFPIPKKKPENIQRYLIRVYMHPRYYKQIYDYLINYQYPQNLFPIYISYSLGDEDIIMNIGADSKETALRFLREHIRSLDGVDQSALYPVFRAKRFAPLDKLIEHQKKYFAMGGKKTTLGEIDQKFDWVEDFEQYAMLTGAFPGYL